MELSALSSDYGHAIDIGVVARVGEEPFACIRIPVKVPAAQAAAAFRSLADAIDRLNTALPREL